MAKAFASQADLAEKKTTFTKLAEGAYCLTAEGDPNSGVIVGDDGVMVIDARATPVMAQDLMRHIRTVTDKPVKYVVLTHYHAVRVMGASGYGAPNIIASRGTYELIRERGAQDFKSEVQRFPRLFQAVETVPGLTWPNIVFDNELTIRMGRREVRIAALGAGHTKGDTIVWLPKERVLFSGDLVEEGATPYCGDAHLTEWPATLAKLEKLKPKRLVPGRGEAMMTPAASAKAIRSTRQFVTELLAQAKKGVKAKKTLKQVFDQTHKAMAPKYGDWVIFEHCMPFCVSRAYDEARGIMHPRIWTAQRDIEMWKALQS
ncbi:MAG TPA: MBL fold metallo-hydrolase [Alphaproteobacteria bacterium]|nr:MBL fold metallo-hydrolase [Alphaproteobacteria bacterium]